ncbi:MAG: enoyl-CoA hydratase/isomerase family protein [Longimicrobiales bacterium]
MTEKFERITWSVEDGLAIVALNRPEKRNALDARTVAELTEAVERAESDSGVRVVLLRGEGRDFCAGGDLEQLQRIATGGGPLDNLNDAAALGNLFVRMRRARMPVVAAVHGNTIAGGAGLATAADLVVASDDAVLAYPEIHLGFMPAMVMALLRRAVGEKVAFDLVANGQRIDASEAMRIGLVNRVFAKDRFAEGSRTFARELASRSASALQLIKRLLYGMDGLSFEEAIARGAEVNVLARATEDTREGVRRFLEKQKQ